MFTMIFDRTRIFLYMKKPDLYLILPDLNLKVELLNEVIYTQ